MKQSFLNPILNIFKNSSSAALKVGDAAPVFQVKTHEGKDFDLNSRQGMWTVLYFYPKADTPGCTKQACAFRDTVKIIRDQNAEVFGVSSDGVESQSRFHKKYNLNFTLLCDVDLNIIKLYGTKMPVLNISKRWTFIIDPSLKIRTIDREIDPVKDAEKVAQLIGQLKQSNN